MDFNEQCYELLRKVPVGRVTTYGAIAKAMGTKAFQAVGLAMNQNPYAPEVPCHRVVKSNGELGGFAHGPRRKIEMLREEGIQVEDGRIVDFDKVFYALQ